VRDNLWAVALPIPGGFMSYSLLYIVRDTDGGMHLIDPGWDSDDNWRRVLDALATIGADAGDVRSTIATHVHPDHSGMGGRARDASGATVRVLDSETASIDVQGIPVDVRERNVVGWGVPESRRQELRDMLDGMPDRVIPTPDATVRDGERLDIPGFDFVVMATPGHTPGSLCVRSDSLGLVFTGDTVLPMMHPGVGIGGPSVSNPLADYLASLEALGRYPDYEVLPGHGYRFTGLGDRAAKSAAHHLRRSAEVRAVMAAEPDASVWRIAEQLTWTAGWDKLVGFYLYSGLAQTAMHRDYVLGRPSD
jgi:glyoxylase-like metal-dependent hydrolase (beta-lactamase superfamily II)